MIDIVVGTSGHVDHGKTFLIKALTGMDTDRLIEEKKRGITIENGFADTVIGDYNISFIDVPGHERFVRNMLIGIGGIDMVLLVIDLEEGVMPQTKEHLEILKMLQIEHGIVVFTKDDSSEDEDWKELVEEDTRQILKGSFLENAPMVRVSAITGHNIEELKQLIQETASKLPRNRKENMPFRLPVDRVFTIDGFGTVVTGTLVEGHVQAGDECLIYPQQHSVKIRNLQVHNEPVEQALAGQRTAINLAKVKKRELERGSVIAPEGTLLPTKMLDVVLTMFDSTERQILNGSQVHFFCGSTETLCKVILLGCEQLDAGQTCYAQLRFEDEICPARTDRYILRFYSPMETIAGGSILDAAPRKKSRTKKEDLEYIRSLDTENIETVFIQMLKDRRVAFPTTKQMAVLCHITENEAEELAESLCQKGEMRKLREEYLIHKDWVEEIEKDGLKICQEYHERQPLERGIKVAGFKKRLEEVRWSDQPLYKELAAEIAISSEEIISDKVFVRARDHQIKLTPELQKLADSLQSRLSEAGFEARTEEELFEGSRDTKTAQQVLSMLIDQEKVIRLDSGCFMDMDAFRNTKDWLVDVASSEGRITLAQVRDRMETSRKYAVMFLEYLDNHGVTRMIDGYRVLK